MSVRKAGGNLPRNAGQRAVQAENKAEDREANMHESRNRDAGRARYLAPQKTSMEAARRAANAKKHEADLDDEATKHMHVDDESMMLKREEEVEEEQKLKGVNLDDERKKRGQRDGSKDDQDANEKEAKKKLGYDDGAGKFFEDVPEDRMGDLSLVDPNDMKRQLGPSVRFAQHAMILADERMKAGMPRQEALEFLANIYLGVHDRNYARKALSKFGAGTGILDIYPLELMEHLLKNVPSFAPKISAGRFFVDPPKKGHRLEAGKPMTLTYPPDLKIRGFAIDGGERPGYVFEPADVEGTYNLTMWTTGKFRVLISALARGGHVQLEELQLEVFPSTDENSEYPEVLKKMRAQDEASEGDDDDEPKKKKKKADDLKFTIPRRI